ncbi:metallophosphoesterase [Deinococcus sp.]|uniref:metallophosphoesterase n=1 Tax=Deinococcus sp. TaxID=47478 RepID=UPI0025B92331|nr:metallophosphoesterase [Deinococcus sp.]
MTELSLPNPDRRRFLRGLLGTGLAAGLLGGSGVAQGFQFGVTQHTASLPGLKRPVTVALLTDMHYGLYIQAGSVRRWVEATNALRPDLILFGGDQVDKRLNTPSAPLLSELARLKAPLGCFGVWGNHDYGSFGKYGGRQYGPPRPDWEARRELLRQEFGQAGIRILRNEGAAVRDDLYLGGTDDLGYGTPDVQASLAGATTHAKLLLTHNPDLMIAKLPQPPGQVPPGLVLCGHTHGGQVRLPLVGALTVPSQYGQRYAMGWVTGAEGTPAYVSRGLGMSGLPLRNLCTPEIAFFTLNPA